MIISKSEFNALVDRTCDKYRGQNLFILFAPLYRKVDKESQSLYILEYDGNNDQYCWLNDWDEGQQYIDLGGIFPEQILVFWLKLKIRKSGYLEI